MSVEELLRITAENPFIVDVTSLESLINTQVEVLLDPEDNFSAWRSFIRTKLPKCAIPVVHLEDPFDATAVHVQIDEFLRRNGFVAIRIPSEFEAIAELVDVLDEYASAYKNMAVLADVGLVMPRSYAGALARVMEVGRFFSGRVPGLFGSLASSFPSSVTQLGDDADGEFPLQEVRISDEIADEFDDLNVVHGDYGCIHPVDMEGMAMNWVPRVDVPLESSLFYHRYRRADGGYIRAARAAVADPRYSVIRSWGHENVVAAAAGTPPGKSPAHWISVRLNLHVERQLQRLG